MAPEAHTWPSTPKVCWFGRGLFIHTHSQQTPKSEPKWFVVSARCPEYSSTVREVVLILQRRRKKKTKQNTQNTKAEYCTSAWNDWKQLKPTSPPHGKHWAQDKAKRPASVLSCWDLSMSHPHPREEVFLQHHTQPVSPAGDPLARSSAVPWSPSPQPGRGTCPVALGPLLLSRQTGECSSARPSQRRLAHAHFVRWLQFPASKADTIAQLISASPETAAACTEPTCNPLNHLGSPEEPHVSDDTTGPTGRPEIRGIEC